MTYIPNAALEAATLANRARVVNQPKQQALPESLVDTTDISVATHNYPGDEGSTMLGFEHLSIDGKFIDADGTVTGYLEVTNDEDASGADWKKVYGYDDINNVVVNQFTVTNGTIEFAISYNITNYRRWRWVVVASGATNTIISKARRV